MIEIISDRTLYESSFTGHDLSFSNRLTTSMNRPNPPITDIGLPLDTEYADDVDFNDEDEENLRALLPIATEVLKD